MRRCEICRRRMGMIAVGGACKYHVKSSGDGFEVLSRRYESKTNKFASVRDLRRSQRQVPARRIRTRSKRAC